MISAIAIIMTIASILAAVIHAEQTAAKQPGATRLSIATATATAAINGLVPKFISTATATWLQGILGDAINVTVALLNVIGILKHSTPTTTTAT